MTKVYGHRGFSKKHPENTIVSFDKALAMGVEGIELDVHLSATNDLVVIHDETIDRTTTGQGIIANMTRSEIAALKTIPFLEEVIQKVPVNELNIELKTDINPYPGIEARLLEMLDSLSPRQRIILSSFNVKTLERLRVLDSQVPLALISSQHIESEVELIERLNLDAIHYEARVVLSEQTKLDLSKVRVWTVNDESEFEVLKAMGVAAIMTDDVTLA